MVKKQFHCPQTSEELQEIASELEVQRLLHLIFFQKWKEQSVQAEEFEETDLVRKKEAAHRKV